MRRFEGGVGGGVAPGSPACVTVTGCPATVSVPTRCVDWTDCPLTALWFACGKNVNVDGEVWWFDRIEFDRCVGAQWPSIFGKRGHVEADIEKDFIDGHEAEWFTALKYMLLSDDRLDRQGGWITIAGRLGTCHAEEIHRIGLRSKGRIRIPAALKCEAKELLKRIGITAESAGLHPREPADDVASSIARKFEEEYPERD